MVHEGREFILIMKQMRRLQVALSLVPDRLECHTTSLPSNTARAAGG